MAIAVEQTVTGSVDGGTQITLGSWTPGSNELVLVGFATFVDDFDITAISGNGLTFVEIFDVINTQGACRLWLYRAMGASPSTGSITIDFAGSVTAIAIASRFSGMDTSGTNGSGAIEATASDPGPAVDNSHMKVDITTLTDGAWALAFGTHRLRTFTVPAGETGISINNAVGSGGAETRISEWYESVASAGTVTVGADNDLNSDHDWIIEAVSIKPETGTDVSDSQPAYLDADADAIDSQPAFLTGPFVATGNQPAYVTAPPIPRSSIPAYLDGIVVSANDNQPAYLAGRVGSFAAGTLQFGGGAHRLANGEYYAVFWDSGQGQLEIWKDLDGTPSQAGSATPAEIWGGGGVAWVDSALDGNGKIHVLMMCGSLQTRDIAYRVFDTATDTWEGSWEQAYNYTGVPNDKRVAIAIDSNNVPHILVCDLQTVDQVIYSNRVGGTWGSVENLSGDTGLNYSDAELAFDGNGDIWAWYYADGNNDPAWRKRTGTTWGSETVLNWTHYVNIRGITVDPNGNRHEYLVMSAPGNTNLQCEDIKYTSNEGSETDTGFNTYQTNEHDPVLAAVYARDTEILFHIDANEDFAVLTNDGGGWSKEVIQAGTYDYTVSAWQYNHNNYGGRIPVMFDDGTNVYFTIYAIETETSDSQPAYLAGKDTTSDNQSAYLSGGTPDEFIQEAFRGYEDDDVEGSATPKAAINVDWTQVTNENFRLRFLVQFRLSISSLSVGEGHVGEDYVGG